MYELKMSNYKKDQPHIGVPFFATGHVILTITKDGADFLHVNSLESPERITETAERIREMCEGLNQYLER